MSELVHQDEAAQRTISFNPMFSSLRFLSAPMAAGKRVSLLPPDRQHLAVLVGIDTHASSTRSSWRYQRGQLADWASAESLDTMNGCSPSEQIGIGIYMQISDARARCCRR